MVRYPTYEEMLNARIVLSKFIKKEMPFNTARKIQLFLDETEDWFINFKYVEAELIHEHAETDEETHKVVTNPDFSIKFKSDEDKKQFDEKLKEILKSNIKYRFDEDNYLVDDDLREITCSPEELKHINWLLIQIGGD